MSDRRILDVGLIANGAKTIVISAVVETVGQVRFGDGTEVNLTVTEKDLIPKSNGDGFVKKVIFSGSKRRGVDRRSVHLFRNQTVRKVEDGQDKGPFFDCFIPALCSECPICWLYGSVGAVGEGEKKKDYNIKSRVLYASACSVEPAEIAVAVHNRNAVNELDHRTGEAGIHSEELIKGGVHFPILTVLDQVVDWEIGVVTHALLENVNGNRYTAASARQGGLRFAENNSERLMVVDVSENGIFPLETVKVPAALIDYSQVLKQFANASDLNTIKCAFEKQGFKCTLNDKTLEVKTNDGTKVLWRIWENTGVITVNQVIVKDSKCEEKLLMIRYVGERAYGYLRERQEDFKRFLEEWNDADWKATVAEVKKRLRLDQQKTAAQGEIPQEIRDIVADGISPGDFKTKAKDAGFSVTIARDNSKVTVKKGRSKVCELPIVDDRVSLPETEPLETEPEAPEQDGE